MHITHLTNGPADRRKILAVIVVYALFSVGWIVLSDNLIQLLFSDPNRLIQVGMLKDWLFVGISSWLLYALMRHWGCDGIPQEERLNALNLLTAIADSSDDAIFAKDLDGRYILFNQAAGNFIGKSAEEVLGRDDRAFFPPEQAEILITLGRKVIAENRSITKEEEIETSAGPRIFLATKGPLRDDQGKVIGIFGISRDITEHRQAEAKLQASELSYRSLFENMINSVVHARIIFEGVRPVDIEYISTNPAFATITGITESVAGRRISAIIPGYCENNPESLEVFGRVAATGISTRWEHYLSELKRWFSFIIYSPAPGEVIIVTDNITDHKQAEMALSQSEERLQLALDATRDGLWDWDLRTGRAYLTPYYYEMTGYRPEDVTADFEFFKRTVFPDDLPRVLEILEAHIQGRTPTCEYEYRLLTRSGEIKWMKGRGRIVERDTEGVPLRMIGTTTDINVRKVAEEFMRRQAEELAQRNNELERFNRAMTGRELDMIALKQRVNELSHQLGREPPYPLVFLDTPSVQQKEEHAP